MARALDVKILRFSVGFGKTMFLRRHGPDATEWVIAAVPLGGYVKMADEREAPVAEGERGRAFNNKSVAARIAIVLAGPVANFLLAFALYWVLFVAGMPGDKPVLADPPANTAAAIAGFTRGDTIVSVGDEPVQTWNDVRWQLLKEAVKRESVAVGVRGEGGAGLEHRIDLTGITRDDLDQDLLAKLGIRPFRPAIVPRLGKVVSGKPAERAGLAAGDLIVGVDAKRIATWEEFTTIVAGSPGRDLAIEVARGGRLLTLHATPDLVKNGRGQLGVEISAEELRIATEPFATTVRYGPVEAIGKSVAKVWDLSVFSVKMLGRMILGDVSWKNLSGPITIADYAGQSAKLGWITSLGFLALVSVSLGVLNLLPIPLLDGGHLVYYFAEIVRGKPVSERTMEIGQRFGLALLLGLTFFAFYNDINRLFTG
jgi:regulator of sigma E protease